MKTINSFKAIIMVAIFSFFIQFAGKAQSFSFTPYAGLCLDQEGIIHSYDPVVGLTAFFKPPTESTFSVFSLGLDMSGGQRYRYQTLIKSMDLKRDSSIFRSTNAPSMMLFASIDIPEGGSDEDNDDEDSKSNPFAGPVVIFGYGIAFTELSPEPANVLKIGLQGNYCLKQDKKARISFFIRPSLNVLYAQGIHEAWDISGGFSVSLFKGSSDE